VSCSVSLSDSESDSSLFSSEWEEVRIDWEGNLRRKVVLLQKIEARRYLQGRGGGGNSEWQNPEYFESTLLDACQ